MYVYTILCYTYILYTLNIYIYINIYNKHIYMLYNTLHIYTCILQTKRDPNKYISVEVMNEMGLGKLVQQCDARVAAAAGMCIKYVHMYTNIVYVKPR